MLQSIQHPGIITQNTLYHVVYEHMPRSRQEAIGNPYHSRQRLTAVGQVIEALVHLERKGLHSRLSCSHVLLHPSRRINLSN
ncbi:hypothetical protein GCG54_00015377 [Colletotrichum gloeosporioides]|uniref:Protein kinase domain-containing protein n=1 Tax=Colletotrichum gloeosporioides TaxID=474922 RepID=A0A8H4FMW4_COLGL|nr:uncharacterized protein GCG54_00015377 [Colletotrichum gloeosporioides]KAF3807992.1 hypothetical protein GCG54_00015377 [Colletotrichum gloeosporioides]